MINPMLSQTLRSTLLADDRGVIRCPCVGRLAVAFGDRRPLAVVQAWLEALGFDDAVAARAQIDLPETPLLCMSDPDPQPLDVATLSPREGLRIALMLGLCTSTHYTPERAVLWTATSLERTLLLYDPAGFYA